MGFLLQGKTEGKRKRQRSNRSLFFCKLALTWPTTQSHTHPKGLEPSALPFPPHPGTARLNLVVVSVFDFKRTV